MGVLYNISKFNLQNTLKFPTQQHFHEKGYKYYVCKERKWIIAGNRSVYHSYKNSTENDLTKKFGLLYVDTEDVEEYYKEYPISKKTILEKMSVCNCESVNDETIYLSNGIKNLKNIAINEIDVEYIKADFGSIDEFLLLDDKIKTLVLQLYHERNLDHRISPGSNWSRNFTCSKSYKVLHNNKHLYDWNDYYQSTKSLYNFHNRCNELNVNEIDADLVIDYLRLNNIYYSEEDEIYYTYTELKNMNYDIDGYIIN